MDLEDIEVQVAPAELVLVYISRTQIIYILTIIQSLIALEEMVDLEAGMVLVVRVD